MWLGRHYGLELALREGDGRIYIDVVPPATDVALEVNAHIRL
jgi:hypothetical protein